MSSRVLLFTGKGGVGKTTIAAATALRCADSGLRTLALSTDPAHSLADALEAELGPLVVPVAPGLWGQQLDAQDRMEDSWADIQRYLREVFQWAGVDALEAEELSVVPGLDEVFALSDIRYHASSGDWDVVVVDCGPTAETVRLLSLPEVLGRYMERLFPIGRRVNRLVAPLVSAVSSLPVADDGVFSATERVYEHLAGVREILTDGRCTSVRLVLTPERMVVAEARRTHTYLSLFGYHVDAVIANRVLPDAVDDPWFAGWKDAHAAQLETVDRAFAPVPVLRAPLAPAEPVGGDALRALAGALYGHDDPTARFGGDAPIRVLGEGPALVLEIGLPFTGREDVELSRSGDELLVRVGPYRRGIHLPDSLRRRQVADARVEDGRLAVSFGPPDGTRGPAVAAGAATGTGSITAMQ
ncbi:MAG: ArsA family ATPase [Acidimicrobiia bacterium]